MQNYEIKFMDDFQKFERKIPNQQKAYTTMSGKCPSRAGYWAIVAGEFLFNTFKVNIENNG